MNSFPEIIGFLTVAVSQMNSGTLFDHKGFVRPRSLYLVAEYMFSDLFKESLYCFVEIKNLHGVIIAL